MGVDPVGFRYVFLQFSSNQAWKYSSIFIQWKKENLPHKELEDCCHVHDYCYDECGADKDVCDLHFKRCLYKVCSDKGKELSVLNLKGTLTLRSNLLK